MRIDAPCKVNPYLAVFGRRDDGYHELATVMVALDLFDTLHFRPASEHGFRLRATAEPPWEGPWPSHAHRLSVPDEGNLIERAYRETCRRLGVSPACEVDLTKRIPVQAGLGGGSADAAAAVVAAFVLANVRFDAAIASEVAAGIGSDVNFFLEGWAGGAWAATCGGRGEKVLPNAAGDGTDWLLVFPATGSDTGAVFRSLSHTAGPWVTRDPAAGCRAAAESIATGNVERIAAVLFNGLTAAARSSNPVLDAVYRGVEAAAPGFDITLSGSGSTIILPCPPQSSASLANRLSQVVQCPVRALTLWKTRSLTEQLDGVRGP